MILTNEEIKEVIAEIPEGHKHIRTRLVLKDGSEYTFQEATIANLVRAYIDIKTHPRKNRVHLVTRPLADKKDGCKDRRCSRRPHSTAAGLSPN